MKYLLGIDVGTSRLKTVLVSDEGKITYQSSVEYHVEKPYHKWAEQNPETWWRAAKETIDETMENSHISPEEIKCIGLSGQMHGLVIVDKNYQPLRPSIIWSDQRSYPQCELIKEKIGEDEFYRITGNNPSATGYTLPVLLWLRENEPDNYKNIHKFLLAKDYIRFKLTGIIATDHSDASSTLLFDTFQRRWSENIISQFNIPDEFLPYVGESLSISGEVSSEAAKETGLFSGTPVSFGGGDQPVGALGIGLTSPGKVAVTVSTGSGVNICVDEPITDFSRKRVHTFCHVFPDKWLLVSGTLTAGESLRWFRDSFLLGSFESLCKEAEEVTVGSDGLIFLPYLAGEHTPHMDPFARGVFLGITLSHRRAHFIRAIMEGVTYSLRDCLEIYKEVNLPVDRIITAGGGSKSRLWRQIQADIFGRDLWVCNIEEHSPYGAAVIAGIATGVFKGVEETCKNLVKYTLSAKFNRENFSKYDRHYLIYKKLYLRLKDIFKELEESQNV